MNHLHDQPPRPNSDPLERLVDAFVGQSVPEGPDEATQRRLLVAMGAADGAWRVVYGAPSSVPISRARMWSPPLLQQAVGLAAAIAVVVGGALYVANRSDVGPVVAQGVFEANQQPAVAASPDDEQPAKVEAATASREIARLVEGYLRTHGGQGPDQRALNAMLADYLKGHPDLARSESWQFAQERLSYALEQPEILGVGVGLLGTLPWATVGRF